MSAGSVGPVDIWLGQKNGGTFFNWKKLAGPVANDGQEDVNLPPGSQGSNWVFYVGAPDGMPMDTSDGLITIRSRSITVTRSRSWSRSSCPRRRRTRR